MLKNAYVHLNMDENNLGINSDTMEEVVFMVSLIVEKVATNFEDDPESLDVYKEHLQLVLDKL